jgi:hypothetical protein
MLDVPQICDDDFDNITGSKEEEESTHQGDALGI